MNPAHGERLVVEIMVICTSPEWDELSKRPGKVIPRVGVDSLEQTQGDPNIYGENVEVLTEKTVEEWTRDGTLCEDEDFERVSVLGSLKKVSHGEVRQR